MAGGRQRARPDQHWRRKQRSTYALQQPGKEKHYIRMGSQELQQWLHPGTLLIQYSVYLIVACYNRGSCSFVHRHLNIRKENFIANASPCANSRKDMELRCTFIRLQRSASVIAPLSTLFTARRTPSVTPSKPIPI